MSLVEQAIPESWIDVSDDPPTSKSELKRLSAEIGVSERKRLSAEVSEEFTQYIQRETVGSSYTTFVFIHRAVINHR